MPAKRVHVSVAEVADEQVAAECAEAGRGERHPPRRVQRSHPRDARDEPAAEVELVDEAAGRAVVAGRRRPPDVAHEHAPPDRPDAERRVPRGDRAVDERTGAVDPPPARVEHLDARVVEVGRVEPERTCDRDRDPAEDRGPPALVDRDLCHARPPVRHDRRPAADRSVLRRVDEPCGPGAIAVRDAEAACSVVDDPGRSAFDGHGQELLRAGARVERARAARLIRGPPGPGRARGETPRVYELTVGAVADEPVNREARGRPSRAACSGDEEQSDSDRPPDHGLGGAVESRTTSRVASSTFRASRV